MFLLLALRPLLNPLYRRRTGTSLTAATIVDLGLTGVLDALRNGGPRASADPPSSPEADVIADAFEKLRDPGRADN